MGCNRCYPNCSCQQSYCVNVGLPGPQGPQGVQGVQGIPGPQGAIGLTGAAGATGATGVQGVRGIPGEKGDRGAQGVQGTTGATGARGPQGEPGEFIVSGGTFFSTSCETIPCDAPIPLDSGCRVIGHGITLANPCDIMIAKPGVYSVSYYFQGEPDGTIETLACCLKLNGAKISGSTVQSVATVLYDVAEPSVSNSCIIEVTTPHSILQLCNNSSSIIEHVRGVEGYCSASVTVLKLC